MIIIVKPRNRPQYKDSCMAFIVLFILFISVCGCDDRQNPDNVQKIRIITTGFMQGRMTPFERHYSRNRTRKYGGPAIVAAVIDKLIEEAKKEGMIPLVVDLGDNLSGSAEALLTKGEMTAKFLSQLPLSATLVGNLEFAHGQSVLEKYFSQMKIPFVATNITKEDGTALPFAHRYIDFMAGDVKILIAGLTPPNLKYICLPANTEGIKVMNWFDEPLKLINNEKAKRKADILLVLSQESLGKKDEKLQKALNNNQVDIFAGLDFSRKGIVRETKNGYTITFPGHNRGQRIGITDFSYSKSRGIFAIATKFKTVDAMTEQPKPSVQQWLTPEVNKYKEELDKEIAVCAASLDRNFFGEGDTGNLVADAIKELTKADLVCINSGGVATSLDKGPVFLRHLYSLIPYQNRIVSFNITGKNLLLFLRRTLGKGSPLQVSGLKLKLRAIEGKRGYEIINVTVNGKPVTEQKIYHFATNDFLKGRSPNLRTEGPITQFGLVRDQVILYLKKHSPYSPPHKNRIATDQ